MMRSFEKGRRLGRRFDSNTVRLRQMKGIGSCMLSLGGVYSARLTVQDLAGVAWGEDCVHWEALWEFKKDGCTFGYAILESARGNLHSNELFVWLGLPRFRQALASSLGSSGKERKCSRVLGMSPTFQVSSHENQTTETGGWLTCHLERALGFFYSFAFEADVCSSGIKVLSDFSVFWSRFVDMPIAAPSQILKMSRRTLLICKLAKFATSKIGPTIAKVNMTINRMIEFVQVSILIKLNLENLEYDCASDVSRFFVLSISFWLSSSNSDFARLKVVASLRIASRSLFKRSISCFSSSTFDVVFLLSDSFFGSDIESLLIFRYLPLQI